MAFFIPKKQFFLHIILLLLLVIAGLFYWNIAPWRNTSATETNSITSLAELNDALELRLVSYQSQLIFPYDFVQPNTNWEQIQKFHQRKKLSQINPFWDESTRQAITIFELALNHNWDLTRQKGLFIVFESSLVLGYSEQTLQQWFDQLNDYRSQQTESSQTISVPPPSLEILHFSLQPADQQETNFPDPPIELTQWVTLQETLEPLVLKKMLTEELLIAIAREQLQNSSLFISGAASLEKINIQWSQLSISTQAPQEKSLDQSDAIQKIKLTPSSKMPPK